MAAYRDPLRHIADRAMVLDMAQSTLDHRVAARIRARLRERHMSQSALAREMGLGVDAMSRRMLGKIPFKAAELPLAAAALDVPVAELLEEDL